MKHFFPLFLFGSLIASTLAIFPHPLLQHERFMQQKVKEIEKNVQYQLPAAQWFTQRLDHFNHQDTTTWQQRYYVNDTFYDPQGPWGGPIFVQIGGEGSISPAYVTELQMVNYAKTYGALAVAVEHRFYGESAPLPDLSTENLVYLTSQQALADAADFIEFIKTQYNAPNAPVVTFGCSYPGALSAFFREKFPTVTMASVASSSPVQATLDFYKYLDVVNASIDWFTGQECDARISEATNTIQTMLQTAQGTQTLQTLFKVCGNLTTQQDIATFMANLMGNWQGVVQYNDEEGNPIDINYLCKIMNNESLDALSAYAKVNDIFVPTGCMDASYADMVTQTQNTVQPTDGVGVRSWTYQTCTEFGYFQTTDSSNQPFGDLVPIDYYTQFCSDVFGLDPNSIQDNIDYTNTYYGGNQIPPTGPTNILFVNGGIDPWHSLGVTEDISDTLRAILIEGCAHCSNVLPESPTDRPSLVLARKLTSIQIGQWLLDNSQKQE